MKSKFISLLLASLLSISITACSNNNRSVNPTDSSNTNTNKTIIDNNSTISNNGTSSNNNSYTSTSKKITSTPGNNSSKQISDVNNKNSIMEVYKAVLKNETEFFNVGSENEYYNVDVGKNVLLDNFATDFVTYGEGSGRFKQRQFAVVDMDGDGVPEVIIKLKKNDLYEVLHYFNGEIYGYTFGVRELCSIKIDGTFSYSGGGRDNGFEKLRFQEGTYIIDSICCRKSTGGNLEDEEYFIDNNQVTDDEYGSFENKQISKKEVIWYNFTDNNIESKLSIAS